MEEEVKSTDLRDSLKALAFALGLNSSEDSTAEIITTYSANDVTGSLGVWGIGQQ